jgi:uncharacterized protein (DUF983 family)
VKRLLPLVHRALRLRCPLCGGAGLFAGWFKPRAVCPGCGFQLEREEGYYLGAMLLNVIVAELIFVAGFALTLVRTWPTPPWTLLTYGSMAAVVVFPILLYPFSRSLWLALDLYIQPPRAEEYERTPAREASPEANAPGQPRAGP